MMRNAENRAETGQDIYKFLRFSMQLFI